MKYDLINDKEKELARGYFDKLCESEAKIEIRKFHGKRTLNQNSYFHVACTILSGYSGYTVPEMKIIIKNQLEFMNYDKGNHHFYRSSAELDKLEFIALVDFVRDFGDSNGCYIPTPEEYIESQFEIEKQLNVG